MKPDNTGSTVVVAAIDPTDPQARAVCERVSSTSWTRGSSRASTPKRSISADDEELRPPAGLLVLAWLRRHAPSVAAR